MQLKSNKVRGLKILIGVACLILIGQRLYASYSVQQLHSVQEIFEHENAVYVAAAFILLFLNWAIEVLKWRRLTLSLEKKTFLELWQSVWVGVCMGNLTPARLGEFAGRVLFFKPEHRAEAGTLHFVGSFAQLIITVVMGCAGLVSYSSGIEGTLFFIILTSELTLLLLVSLILLKINTVIAWVRRQSFLKKYHFSNLRVKKKEIMKLLCLSLCRYLVFSLQFYLLLLACGVQGSWWQVCGAITVAYLLLSTIPMISFVEVAIRAFVVTLLFGHLGSNDWKLSTASTLLWFINIVFPSLLGYVFFMRNKFSFQRI
ncbi:MAG: flippase-like domain-containing protein [Bacteroidetes bacterium]|nr:flippase-like domain-containing protein [Bacteroidota bacterium]